MARFNVYRPKTGHGLWLDCQADQLSYLSHRFAIPMLPPEDAPRPGLALLNPVFEIEGMPWVMLTQFAATVLVRDMGAWAADLSAHDRHIMNAIDHLLSGI